MSNVVDLFAGAALCSRVNVIDRQIDRLQQEIASSGTRWRVATQVMERLQLARVELIICRAIISAGD